MPTTTTTTSNYSVYRAKTLSQQACSIRRLSAAPPRRISAPCGPHSTPLLNFHRFCNTLVSLSPLFLQPILGRDFRRWQNAGTGKQPIGSPREKGTWMGGRGRDRMTRAVLLSDTSKRSRDPPLSAPDKLLIPESWPLSPLNPDKERYLAPSGTKGAVEVVSTTATDPLSPHLRYSRFLFTFLSLLLSPPACSPTRLFVFLFSFCRRCPLGHEKKVSPSLLALFSLSVFSPLPSPRSLRPWRRDSVYPPRVILAF